MRVVFVGGADEWKITETNKQPWFNPGGTRCAIVGMSAFHLTFILNTTASTSIVRFCSTTPTQVIIQCIL